MKTTENSSFYRTDKRLIINAFSPTPVVLLLLQTFKTLGWCDDCKEKHGDGQLEMRLAVGSTSASDTYKNPAA